MYFVVFFNFAPDKFTSKNTKINAVRTFQTFTVVVNYWSNLQQKCDFKNMIQDTGIMKDKKQTLEMCWNLESFNTFLQSKIAEEKKTWKWNEKDWNLNPHHTPDDALLLQWAVKINL